MKKLLTDAEDMLLIFEGALSSCHDREALPDKVFAALVKRSKSIRKQLKKRIDERDRRISELEDELTEAQDALAEVVGKVSDLEGQIGDMTDGAG